MRGPCVGLWQSSNESDMFSTLKDHLHRGEPDSRAKATQNCPRGHDCPSAAPHPAPQRKDFMEMMPVLSHVEAGKKDSKQMEQPDDRSKVKKADLHRELKAWAYWGIKCETGNGTSEAENVSKGQNKLLNFKGVWALF